MSGALNSVMGGGGGGLLGAVGGIVGGMFGGPIGAMIGQAIGNMVQEAVGDAVKDGITQLQQEHGMPKFLADAAKDKVTGIVDGLKNNDVPAEAQQAAQEQFGGAVNDFKNDFQQSFVDAVIDNLRGQGGEEAKAAKGGKKGGEGWLQAIAKAFGETLGKKASDLVELSNEMSAINSQRTFKQGDKDDAALAADFNEAMTKFQATSQEFNLLQNTFSTALKAIGEGLSGMARKQ
jgi:hypothetical protein